MSLELSFSGQIKSRKRIIKQITEKAERYSYGVYADHDNSIIVTLCPTGDITFNITEGGFLQKGKIEGCFQSTPAGPGFHKAAIEFIDSLNIENLEYEDDTEYVVNRDFAKLCVNHFQRWLKDQSYRSLIFFSRRSEVIDLFSMLQSVRHFARKNKHFTKYLST